MNEWELDTATKVTTTRLALESGKLQLPPDVAKELLAAPRTPLGLVDISKLSKSAIMLGRSAGMAASFMQQQGPTSARKELDPAESQVELFRLFGLMFAALVGVSADLVQDYDNVRTRVIWRAEHEGQSFARSFNAATEELVEFYKERAGEIFRQAKQIGGVKAVAGGQRYFGHAGLEATRIAGLYLDTQAIPDPIYPFLTADLRLNALHLQLALQLYHVLQLQPLIDARLPVPPVFLFPSFEQALEKGDPITMAGLEALTLKVVAPVCEGSFFSVKELFEYANRHGAKFLPAAMRAGLFVPQGADPGAVTDWKSALEINFSELKGQRDAKTLAMLESMAPGVALLMGVMERLGPQYHLMENATELGAQPLMALPVQWHYFELCSRATARELVNDKVLSETSFTTLRALQDDSVSWLANIPIAGLLDLRRNMEGIAFREELEKCTAQLAAAGPPNLDEVVREVNHALASLIQRHAKGMEDLRSKCWPKLVGVAASAALGAAGGASFAFLPSLAVAASVSAPVGTVLGALAGGALNVVKEIATTKAEGHQARRSLLGMLAKAKQADSTL